MYNGEVNIYQEELDRFLDIAQRLKLEGLMADIEKDPVGPNFETEDCNEDTPFVNKHEALKAPVLINALTSFEELGSISRNSGDIDKINEKIEEYIDRDDQGRYKCTYCGKIGDKYKSHIKNHIETHLEGLLFPCQLCDKSFRSRNSLGVHKNGTH